VLRNSWPLTAHRFIGQGVACGSVNQTELQHYYCSRCSVCSRRYSVFTVFTEVGEEKQMPDQSDLDQKYFIDRYIYNCPFCNRRPVSYVLGPHRVFDWTNLKKCFVYFAQCQSCNNISMHLSFEAIPTQHAGTSTKSGAFFRFETDNNLDQKFFYSVPTSFFVLDERIPRKLRELVTEAEGCLKSNFLTGASACARKVVYELGVLQGATGANYEDRIKSLKSLHPEVDSVFFDTLLTIQQTTSSKVHEESYDGWEAKHLRIILLSLADVLHEIYIVPALKEDRRKSILKLKEDLLGGKTS